MCYHVPMIKMKSPDVGLKSIKFGTQIYQLTDGVAELSEAHAAIAEELRWTKVVAGIVTEQKSITRHPEASDNVSDEDVSVKSEEGKPKRSSRRSNKRIERSE